MKKLQNTMAYLLLLGALSACSVQQVIRNTDTPSEQLASPVSGRTTGSAKTSPAEARLAEVRQTVREMSVHASTVLLQENGMGRADYEYVSSTWLEYETHWHTGQLIWALIEAGQLLDDADLIEDAKHAGNWWVSTEFKEPHPFAGLVNAYHGDRLGHLINWTTISDGTPGLFALSRATGNPKYADSATRSGQWLWDNTRVPEEIEGGEWLFYNLFDPKSGVVLTDWNAHTQGIDYDAEEAKRKGPPPITELARPNIEGFLFKDMCNHTSDIIWCERFLQQADYTLRRQWDNGLWMDFEPNQIDRQVHPRFNIWNAEALVEAFEISGDRKYLEGAAKTARFFRDAARGDGTIYYRTHPDGTYQRDSITGSAVAFNGILMLRLKAYGYDEFDKQIEKSVDWVIKNRFANDHPDPNLAGAVINTRYKPKSGVTRYVNRDVGTTFAIRFLADYHQMMSPEN